MDIKTQKTLANIVLNANKKTVQPYTTTATVKSITDNTIYVSIPGSDSVTPVKASSVSVNPGDVVDLVVSHNDTHITGNRSDVATSVSATEKVSKALEASRLEMDNQLDMVGNKITAINNTIDMQNSTIEMQGSEITSINDKINSQNNIIEQQGNTITQLGNTVNQQGNTITEVNNKVESYDNTITQMENTITQQGNTITEVDNKVTSQGNTITEMNDKITSQGNTINSQGNTITEMNDTITSQGNTITQIGDTVTSQGNTITQQGNTITEINSTIETLNSTVQTQGSSIETLDSSIKIVNSAFVIQNGKMVGISEILTNILDSDYVTTDLLNANVAWIENGKIKEGAIGTVEIHDSSITTAKIAELSADVIKTGTLKTECLILTTDEVDPDTGEKKVALITALNAKTKAGEGDILDGAIVKDGTIEAAKITVVDLNAFGATIGNFNIGTSSMYNNKTSLNDPTDGVYIGTDGIALGQGSLLNMTDDSPFRVESDGDFHLGGKDSNYINFDPFEGKLDINADNIKIGSSSVASKSYVDQTAEGITTTVESVDGRLTTMEQNSEGFTWTIDKTAIVSSVDEYYKSTSATSLSGGSWSENSPDWTQGTYIWRRTKTTNGKGTVSYGEPVCITGNTGATGAQGPQGEKGDTGAQGEQGIQGEKGATGADGRGISNTTVTYQAGSSGTTVPTGTWSTSVPSVSAGQYLWTKTVTTYTSGNPTTAYSVGRMGTNGQNGTNGTNGTDGKGIKSTAITYQAWSSGTTTPTGTWSTSVPSTTADKPYLWTKTVITYTDDTTSTSYSVGSTPEGIVVGGKNILRNSKFNSNADKWTIQGNAISEYVIKDGRKCAHINHSALKYTKTVSQSIFGKLEPSTQYTMSGWVLTENLVKGTTNFTCMFYCDGSYLNNGTATWYGYGSKGFPINTGEWTHLEWTFSTDSAKFATATTCNMFVHTRDLTGDIYFSDLKLEKGNKATDWTPAPEDVEQAIEDVEVGGQNLLSDTNIPSMTKKTGPGDKYLSDSGNSSYSTGEFVAVSNLPVPGFTHVFRFTCTTASSTATAGRSLCFYSGATVPMINGEEYTMSMYARKTSGNGKIRFLVGYSKYPDYDNYIDVTSEWKRYSYTFTYSDSATGGSGGARVYFGASCAVVGVVETFGWKLERGNKATDWSLSVEAGKTATNYMNFSDDGLVVGDMTADTLGKNVLIDSDSVDIRNGTNVLASYGENIILKHGDKDAFTIKKTDFFGKAQASNRYYYEDGQREGTSTTLNKITDAKGRSLVKDTYYIWGFNAGVSSYNIKYAIYQAPATGTASEIVWEPSHTAYLTITIGSNTYKTPCAYADDSAVTNITCKGNIWIENTSDVNGRIESIPPLGIGTVDGAHLAIDNNEISAKEDGETPSTLYLNMEGGPVSLNNNGNSSLKFDEGIIYARYGSTYVYSPWYEVLNCLDKTGNYRTIDLGYGPYSQGFGTTAIHGDTIELTSNHDIQINGKNIEFDNVYGLTGKNTSGVVRRNIQLVNGNNNFVLGYDSYTAKEGATNIYGNTISLMTNSTITSNRSLKVLCTTAWVMGASDTITLSEKVSDQLNGIVLVWSYRVNGTAQNYNWNHIFVPKTFVANNSGQGTAMLLAGSTPGYKYVYIKDNTISGNAANTSTSTNVGGMTCVPNNYALRYVFGV